MNFELAKRTNILDISPKNDRTGRTVVIAPGWRETIRTNRATAFEIAGLGRRTFTFEFRPEAKPPVTFLHEKTRLMNELIEDADLGEIDVILTSESAIYGLRAVSKKPENVKAVLLIDPAGLTEPIKLPEAFIRFNKTSKNGLINFFKYPDKYMPLWNNFINVGTYVLPHLSTSLNEASCIFGSNTQGLLSEVAQMGIPISIASSVKDSIYPYKKITERFGEVGYSSDNPPPIRGFYTLKGGHSDRVTYASTFAKFAVNAFDNLERQKA